MQAAAKRPWRCGPPIGCEDTSQPFVSDRRSAHLQRGSAAPTPSLCPLCLRGRILSDLSGDRRSQRLCGS